MSEPKRQIDWDSIERDFRAGTLSIREIGRINNVSDKAIRNKAEALGWDRDLSAKVNEKVRSELVRTESASAEQKQTEREIIEVAAATVVQVVRGHRKQISQGNALVELLTKQLTDVAGKRDEFEAAIEIECSEDKSPERLNRLMRAVSLEKHAAIAANLANATKTWVGLERQAFSIPDSDSQPEPLDADKRAARIAALQAKLAK